MYEKAYVNTAPPPRDSNQKILKLGQLAEGAAILAESKTQRKIALA